MIKSKRKLNKRNLIVGAIHDKKHKVVFYRDLNQNGCLIVEDKVSGKFYPFLEEFSAREEVEQFFGRLLKDMSIFTASDDFEVKGMRLEVLK